MDLPLVLDLAAVRLLYADGATPQALLAALDERIDAADPAVFISRAPAEMLQGAVTALLARAPEPNSLPLWGVPFAVKDNIDVAGLPTTCACPAFARVPMADAGVVAKLVAAGGIVIGKTNLDQFATGLNGTRSPYGIPRSVFDPEHISGGSSSGSAVAVAAGLASFALGTDTAGSGRVPAAFNNLVGIKPTPGLLSTRGVVPACASLDCVSIFALSVADGSQVRRVAEGYDAADPWSRIAQPRPLPSQGLRIGVLPQAGREFFGIAEHADLYRQAIARTAGEPVEIDYAPFQDVASLLYEGPWVAERQAAFAGFGIDDSALDPAVAAILAGSARFSAVDAFGGFHRLAELKRRCEVELDRVDVLLLPTAPRSYTVAEMAAEPIAANARLGIYTNFCNLLGLAAIAVPAGFTSAGLPFGVTLLARPFADDALALLADRLHRESGCGAGIDRSATPATLSEPAPSPDRIELAVVGAHLSGMPLNHELVALGATLAARTRTTAEYRLFVLPGTQPAKPGLVRSPGAAGPGIELEIWSLPPAGFARFVAAIPSPLGIGRLQLAGGGEVSGFLCEPWAVQEAREITAVGGWRAFCESRSVSDSG
ncbi:MAG: allophanate hydrolase [Novosphingobium sp.]